MIKNIIIALLLISFSIISRAQENPTFVVVCNDCSSQDISTWFLNNIVIRSSDNQEATHRKIWSNNRVLVFKPDTADFDVFELNASPAALLSGISESTFDVTQDSVSEAEAALARNLLKYNASLNQRVDSVAQQLSHSFGSASSFNKWLDSKHPIVTSSAEVTPAFKSYGDSCLDDPQYLTISALYSKGVTMELQNRASKLAEAQMQLEKFGNTRFSNEQRFIKGVTDDLSLFLVKNVFDHKQPIKLTFDKEVSETPLSTASFLLALKGSKLKVKPSINSSKLGGVSLDILKSYGGEVSQCAVIAMNEVIKPTVIKQTSIVPKLKSNINDENSHLCSYIYGGMRSQERITLGATCSIVRDKSFIKDLHFKS